MTYSQDYHRYLKVPFDPIKPKLFHTQPDKTFEAEQQSIDSRINTWLNQFGVEVHHHEVFYTAPHDKLYIHLDTPVKFDNHVKINFTWGSNESVMRWWKVKDKKKLRYQESEDYKTGLIVANEDQCDMQYEQVINKPSLVNVGCLHSTYNPSDIGRWTICIVPTLIGSKQKYQSTSKIIDHRRLIHWNDAIEIFKEVII